MKKISSDHPDDVDKDALDELMKSFLMNLIKTFQKSITSFLVLGKQVFISTFLRKSGANKKRKYIFNLSELYIPPPTRTNFSHVSSTNV